MALTCRVEEPSTASISDMDLEANSFQHGHVGASCNASLQPKPRFPQQIRILFLCTHTARREEKEYQVHGVGNVRFVYGSGKPFYDDKPAVQTHCRKTIAQNSHDVVVAVIEENTLEDVDIGTGRHAFEIVAFDQLAAWQRAALAAARRLDRRSTFQQDT